VKEFSQPKYHAIIKPKHYITKYISYAIHTLQMSTVCAYVNDK